MAREHEHRRGLYFMIFLLLYGFLFSIAISVILYSLEWYILHDTDIGLREIVSSPWFIIFTQVAGFLVPLGIWLHLSAEKINQHLPPMRLGKRNIILIVGISIMLMPAANVVSGITMLFFPNQISGFVMVLLENQPLFLVLLALAVTPAICEEVVFRGYIQSTYRYKPFITMVLANGLFFAVIHQSPQQFFYTFIMGIIFAYMVHATQSIRAGVISHFVMNATSILFVWFSLRMAEVAERLQEHAESLTAELATEYIYTAPAEISEQMQILIAIALWGVIAIFTTTAAVFLFRDFSRHNKKRVAKYEAKLAAELPEIEKIIEESLPDPEPPPSPEQNRKNLLTDTALVLVIVALYVIFVLV
ncbi:MAG: CPBP family intramembrane metalloprotease [Defluviitaleaceae bacterium]|nr:CPBP family intramembrane metalloprotease [Defluviitaleaceae bacterium]MCL2262877.1 CPBP family intramembrane metalloprotease [Defluviitaleaceae bacterium]